MEYKRWREKLVLRLDPGEEVGECLLEVGRKEDTRLAKTLGLGAASLAELGVFDTKAKGFTEAHYQRTYEITSITSSITRLDGEPYPHAHMVIGSLNHGECHGEHMVRAVISATMGTFVSIMSGQVEQETGEEIGLHLLDL